MPFTIDGTNGLTFPDASTLASAPTTNVTVTTYTSGSGTWTKPSTGTFARVRLWGAGASGEKNVNTTTGNSAFGGGGGSYVENTYRLADLNATESYSIGAGGTAITATTSTNGNPGGNTTFKNVTAYGAGASTFYFGASVSGVSSIRPVGQTSSQINAFTQWDGASVASTGGGNAIFGGAGGGSCSDLNVLQSAGTSMFGGNGGAANSTVGGTATSGSAPGGGGGAKLNGTTGSSGAGGAGRIEIWVW